MRSVPHEVWAALRARVEGQLAHRQEPCPAEKVPTGHFRHGV